MVSYPIIIGALIIALTVYFKYYRIQKDIDHKYPLKKKKSTITIEGKIIRMLPSIGYSLSIIPMKVIYKKIATYLTEFGMIKIKNKKKIEFFDFYRKSSFTNNI